MTKARRQVVRLAFLLHVAGIEPVLAGDSYREMRAGLEQQLSVLTRSRRRKVRRRANRSISEAQGLENAGNHLVPHPLIPESTRRQPPIELNQKQMQLLSSETPPCPVCRMRIGRPKHSWPSREMADQVRERQNDPQLAIYSCPAGHGWHLGHRSDASSATTGHPATTARREKPHRTGAQAHSPIFLNPPQTETPIKMNATLRNPLFITFYGTALLLIGCAVGMHWAHTPATALGLAIAGGLLMATHDTAMGFLWFWVTALWAGSVIERNHRR
jgi:hypothetical protein